MIGVLFGGACGAVELVLLKLLADKVSAGQIPIWILPLKLFVIPLFLVPCALIARDQLHIAGIAGGAVLILGAVAIFCLRAYKDRTRDAERHNIMKRKPSASEFDGGEPK